MGSLESAGFEGAEDGAGGGGGAEGVGVGGGDAVEEAEGDEGVVGRWGVRWVRVGCVLVGGEEYDQFKRLGDVVS